MPKKITKGNKINGAWKVGEKYFIRTVTLYYIGQLVSVDDHELVLSNAAWIADTGRFADAMKSGNFDEVEPFPLGEIIIGRGAIVDAAVFCGTLPLAQK